MHTCVCVCICEDSVATAREAMNKLSTTGNRYSTHAYTQIHAYALDIHEMVIGLWP